MSVSTVLEESARRRARDEGAKAERERALRAYRRWADEGGVWIDWEWPERDDFRPPEYHLPPPSYGERVEQGREYRALLAWFESEAESLAHTKAALVSGPIRWARVRRWLRRRAYPLLRAEPRWRLDRIPYRAPVGSAAVGVGYFNAVDADASLHGLARAPGETDEQLRDRLLYRMESDRALYGFSVHEKRWEGTD